MMELFIDCRSAIALPAHFEDIIYKTAQQALKAAANCECYEISVSIVDDNEIRAINKRFRRIDNETDVLSFPALTDFDDCKAEDVRLLGDIIISARRIFAQAAQFGHSPERELGFLTAHGMLHLLGYDHMTVEDEQGMNTLQEQIMRELGLTR